MTRRRLTRLRRSWNAQRRVLLRHPITGRMLRGPRWDQIEMRRDGWEFKD